MFGFSQYLSMMLAVPVVLVALLSLGLALPPNIREEARFLETNGFGHLIGNFEAEEITFNYFDRLTDDQLQQLGVTTMGSRIRFRDALSTWTEHETDQQQGGVEGVEVQTDVGPAAEPDGAAGEVVGDDGGEEEEETTQLLFYSKVLSTGRIVHHFLDQFYRFDRNKVKGSL